MKPCEWIREGLVFYVSSDQLRDGLRLGSLGQHHQHQQQHQRQHKHHQHHPEQVDYANKLIMQAPRPYSNLY